MSALWGLAVNGSIPYGSGPVVSYRGSAPFNAAGQLVAATSGGLTVRWLNGLPYDANGEVMFQTLDPIAGGFCGLPITANRHIAAGLGPVTHYSNGVPFNASGRVVIG